MFLQSRDRTLTGEFADDLVKQVLSATEAKLGAKLLA